VSLLRTPFLIRQHNLIGIRGILNKNSTDFIKRSILSLSTENSCCQLIFGFEQAQAGDLDLRLASPTGFYNFEPYDKKGSEYLYFCNKKTSHENMKGYKGWW